MLFVDLDADGEGALQDAEDVVEIALADGGELEADGEDDVRSHGFDVGCGKVLEDRAVDVFMAVELEGTEDAGDGCGGEDGIAQRAAGEGDGPGGVEVGGLAAEGDGQAIEVGLIVVAEELFFEELVEAGFGEEAVAELDAMLEADGDAVGDVAAVFAAAKALRAVGLLDAEDGADGVFGEDVLHLVGGVAGGVESADDGAHAGAGDDVDGDVMIVKPLQDADLAHGLRAASAEGEADDGAVGGEIGGRGGGIEWAEREARGAGGCFAGGCGMRILLRGLVVLRGGCWLALVAAFLAACSGVRGGLR